MQRDEKKVMAPTGKVGMEKVLRGDEGISSITHQQQQPVQQLKCPRCNSSNTKFCYYNNYSLSQPRHFCKACKRYWTRGGTLRNVPVGGGCRKNKRLKRPSPTTTTTATSASHLLPHPSSTPNHDHVINPYGLSNPHQLMGLPFSAADVHGYHHHHQQLHHQPDQDLNALAFGFSSGIMIMSSGADGGKQLFQDVDLDLLRSNNSPLSSTRPNIPIFSSSTPPSPTIHNLQPSTFHHQNHSTRAVVKEETASQYTHLQALIEEEGKVQNRLEQYWNPPYLNSQTHQLGFTSSEPSPLYWNSNTTVTPPIAASHDPPNFASSLDRVLHLPS